MISGRNEAERAATARAERERRRTDAAAVLRSAREVMGWSRADLASVAGSGTRELASAWEDPEGRANAPLELALLPGLGEHILEQLAVAHGKVLVDPVSVGERPTNDLKIAVELQRECSEAVAAFLFAISDGLVTRPERDDVRAATRDAIRVLMQLDAALEADGREPVVGVRGLREVGR